jgi:hypothetical protein
MPQQVNLLDVTESDNMSEQDFMEIINEFKIDKKCKLKFQTKVTAKHPPLKHATTYSTYAPHVQSVHDTRVHRTGWLGS